VSVLYFSYDGATEALGQSQVVAYLVGLARRGHRVALVSFEKPDAPADAVARCREELHAAGVAWLPQRYHRRPTVPATAYDMAAGVLAGLAARRRGRVRLLHARGHVPAMMCLALKPLLGARFLFDVRNFWADEKVDAGSWPRGGALWRATKQMERRFFRAADHVVTLTEAARRELGTFDYLRDRVPPSTVIPTCVDLALFRRAAGAAPASADLAAPLVAYTGSLGGRYQDEVVGRFFGAMRACAPAARFEVWTRQDSSRLRAAAGAAGVPEAALRVTAGDRSAVAAALGRCHAGVSFLNDGYSNRSSLPTKMPEYLACGLAVVTSPGVGDLDGQLAEARAGVTLPTCAPSDEELRAAARRTVELLREPELPARARSLAEREFALEAGVGRYDAVYRLLGA
jgi:glycosyltransferase involved in cell wall biosynthesis